MSGQIDKVATSNETIAVLPCPFCGGPVIVKSCRPNRAEPAYAQCKPCRRRWNLGLIDAARGHQLWNRRQPYIIELEQLRARIKQIEALINSGEPNVQSND